MLELCSKPCTRHCLVALHKGRAPYESLLGWYVFLFFKLSFFERESLGEKQKTQRRFIALYFVGLMTVRSPARACSHEHVVRPLAYMAPGRISCRSAKIHLARTIYMFAQKGSRRGSAVSLLKRNVSGRRNVWNLNSHKIKSDQTAGLLLLFRSFSFKKRKNTCK